MSVGKEKVYSKSAQSSPWLHPEKLTPEERDRLIYTVPKDTIELLKEGHSEYIIK